MRHRALVPLVTLLLGLTSITWGTEARVDLPRYPALSPNGETVVFSWGGNLWKVGVKGGEAVRLTDLQGDALRAVFNPDGKRLAFCTTHPGAMNVYVMNIDGTDLRQLTWTERGAVPTGFMRENEREYVVFHSALELDAFGQTRLYSVPVEGGEPRRLNDAFGDFAVVSPDGKHVLFTRGSASWQRRHNRGSTTRDIWLLTRENGSFRRLTTHEGQDGQPRWLSNKEFAFLSDRELGCMNVYTQRIDRSEEPRRITRFSDNDVQSFDVSADGKNAIVHVWDTLYSVNLRKENGEAQPLKINASARPLADELVRFADRATDATLSPDGQVLAFVAQQEVFVRDVQSKSPTVRVTFNNGRKKDVAWSPDGSKLYFVSDETGVDNLYTATVTLTRGEIRASQLALLKTAPAPGAPAEAQPAAAEPAKPMTEGGAGETSSTPTSTSVPAPDAPAAPAPVVTETPKVISAPLPPGSRWKEAVRFKIEPLLSGSFNDAAPAPSRDGRYIAFKRDLGKLMLLDTASNQTRELSEGVDPYLHWSWSADSRFIAFAQNDRDDNRDVWVVPADGSTPPVNVSQHPAQDYAPTWSADGKQLAFLSSRVEDQYDVWTVNLDRSMDNYTPRQWDEHFKDSTNAVKRFKPLAPGKLTTRNDAKKPVLDLSDAYMRLRRITFTQGNESNLALLPGGDRVIYRSPDGLASARYDGGDPRRLGLNSALVELTLQGDKALVLDDGKPGLVSPMGGEVQWIEISERLRVSRRERNKQIFGELARVLGQRFYHPSMKGLNWKALTEKYSALAVRTLTPNELSDVANRFLGELNASHMGYSTPDIYIPNSQTYGHLGATLERTPSGYRVRHVLADGPLDIAAVKLLPGDSITAINEEAFTPNEPLAARLEGRIGREVLLTVQRDVGSGTPAEFRVLTTPVAGSAIQELSYKAWLATCAQRVKEWSHGRLGYEHIRRMDESSLDVYERDLYAAAHGKEGLLIDVRNNHGGRISDRLLASLMAPRHSFTLPRGTSPDTADAYPLGYLYIQRYLLPINVLCNGQSASNAEIFSHAIKTLKRGTLVGEPTNGAVISTGSFTLADGSTVRIPARGWFLPDGRDMENTPADPDLRVPMTPEAEVAGDDPQLRTAVEDLLQRLAQAPQKVAPKFDQSVPVK